MKYWAILSLLLVFGCNTTKNNSRVENRALNNSVVGSIYMIDTPNNIYKPGDILIRDMKSGGLTRLTTIDVKVLEGDVQIPNKEISKDNSFSGLLNFLGLENLPLSVTPKTLRESNVTISLESSNVKLKYLEDGLLPLTNKIRDANEDIKNSQQDLQINKKKEEIILITDLYYSNEVVFKIDGGRNKIDSLNAGFDKIANLNLGIKKRDSVGIDLTIKRDEPLGFAYKRRVLKIKKRYGGIQIYLPKN